MSAINEKYIKGPFKADFRGGYIFSGPDNFTFAEVRGWGQLKYVENGEKIQDANLQFMVDALNEKASGALKKAGDEIADLSHPEFGELGRLQEEIHELKKEIDWLTFYKKEVYQCLGSGVDDVNKSIRDAYVKGMGLARVPGKLRKEYLDYEADHKDD